MEVNDMMDAFMGMQKKQHAESIYVEQQHHQQEKETLERRTKVQMEMGDLWLQKQMEEGQETNRMFHQMMSTLLDAMVPFFQQHTPSYHQQPPPHYSDPAHEQTPAANTEQPLRYTQDYHML